MTRAAHIVWLLLAAGAGCGGPPEFAIEIQNPTDCGAPADIDVTSYWLALEQSGDRECVGGGCPDAGEPRACLANVATPAVVPGEALTLTVGVYDIAGELIACGRSGVSTVADDSTIYLALSCDIGVCPNTFQLDCPAQTGLQPCPIVNGVDGAGVCTRWAFVEWSEPCTEGYARERVCDPDYECRTSDRNGCDSPLNLGQGDVPSGCPECNAGG